ncbi:CorA family magnesium transporter [Aspergillus saccharolyticus JOP 1030-1]|uniref:Magnesium transporter n=1 Tax=Aspergillus saccharolyticus JOP 1030-1 TaxID=1450539 RepID=A0A318Z2Y7_9EURO|nr:putative RNA splicing protein mrs2, mitochondrial [Aspergillus saccharolyticus JOP 1030-1]PYH41635.1 putative RNA splicing protein mrs2, mitochondrial [Aspergillus saccharolyticus JOP 1030-1]
MQYTQFQNHGTAFPVGHITKLAVADRYGLSTRDLRVFDQPSSGVPYILVRESTLLLHILDLRVLVQHDHARLFHVAHVPPSLDHTQGSDENRVSRVFSHIMQEKLRDGQQPGKAERQPFELCVLEAALSAVTSVLEAECSLAEQEVSQTLQITDASTPNGDEPVTHLRLRTILELKRKLVGIEQRALQVRNMAQEVLNEDQDMANMHLTDKQAGKPHMVQDHQGVEYLFEAYFKASDTIGQDAASLMSHLQRTEDTIRYTLNVRRNQIMMLEVRLEILMLALAGATLIAGWYGMNLVNYFEDSPHAFAVVVLLSCAAVLGSSWYGMHRLRRIRTAQLHV